MDSRVRLIQSKVSEAGNKNIRLDLNIPQYETITVKPVPQREILQLYIVD